MMYTKNFKEKFYLNEDSSQLLSMLFQEKKKYQSQLSLEFLTRKLNLKSKSYLSEILSGKRRLSLTHRFRIAESFSMDRLMTRYFVLVLEREHEAYDKWKVQITNEIKNLRKNIEIEERHLTDNFNGKDGLMLLKLFAAFGIFKSSPLLEDFKSIFPHDDAAKVEKLLKLLVDTEAIEEVNAHFNILSPQVIFKYLKSSTREIQALQAGMSNASQEIEKWYSNKEQSFFHQSYISVQKKEYKTLLKKLRDDVSLWHSQAESEKAETVVSFSLQVFPDLPSL